MTSGCALGQICNFKTDTTGALACDRNSDGYCVIRLSALSCLEKKEKAGDKIPPIVLMPGEVVIWRGEHKPQGGNPPCTDDPAGISNCLSFYFAPFQPLNPTGPNDFCGAKKTTPPFVSKFDDENPSGGKPRLQHSKASSVRINATPGSCYKHVIHLEDGTQIDPHIIIGGARRPKDKEK